MLAAYKQVGPRFSHTKQWSGSPAVEHNPEHCSIYQNCSGSKSIVDWSSVQKLCRTAAEPGHCPVLESRGLTFLCCQHRG